jgi:hypothetical protein
MIFAAVPSSPRGWREANEGGNQGDSARYQCRLKSSDRADRDLIAIDDAMKAA